MLGGERITTSEIAAIEIFIEALETQCGKYELEANATKSMLRKYLDTKASRYYAMANETFNDINADVRADICNRASKIAYTNRRGGGVKIRSNVVAAESDFLILQQAMASLKASVAVA